MRETVLWHFIVTRNAGTCQVNSVVYYLPRRYPAFGFLCLFVCLLACLFVWNDAAVLVVIATFQENGYNMKLSKINNAQ